MRRPYTMFHTFNNGVRPTFAVMVAFVCGRDGRAMRAPTAVVALVWIRKSFVIMDAFVAWLKLARLCAPQQKPTRTPNQKLQTPTAHYGEKFLNVQLFVLDFRAKPPIAVSLMAQSQRLTLTAYVIKRARLYGFAHLTLNEPLIHNGRLVHAITLRVSKGTALWRACICANPRCRLTRPCCAYAT
jgi:hypothetical protein